MCEFFDCVKDAESQQTERKVLERIGRVSYGSLMGLLIIFLWVGRLTIASKLLFFIGGHYKERSAGEEKDQIRIL